MIAAIWRNKRQRRLDLCARIDRQVSTRSDWGYAALLFRLIYRFAQAFQKPRIDIRHIGWRPRKRASRNGEILPAAEHLKADIVGFESGLLLVVEIVCDENMHAFAGNRILGIARASLDDRQSPGRDASGLEVYRVVDVDPDQTIAWQKGKADPGVVPTGQFLAHRLKWGKCGPVIRIALDTHTTLAAQVIRHLARFFVAVGFAFPQQPLRLGAQSGRHCGKLRSACRRISVHVQNVTRAGEMSNGRR